MSKQAVRPYFEDGKRVFLYAEVGRALALTMEQRSDERLVAAFEAYRESYDTTSCMGGSEEGWLRAEFLQDLAVQNILSVCEELGVPALDAYPCSSVRVSPGCRVAFTPRDHEDGGEAVLLEEDYEWFVA